MISVFDCVSAITKAIQLDCPNETLNLGSKNPCSVYELLSKLIKQAGSHSKLLKTNAHFMMFLMRSLAYLGIELMYPEQYLLADKQYIVDITLTQECLSWEPQYNDEQMIFQAFNQYQRGQHPDV